MAITVKHLKVSLIPDSGDDTLIEPSDWNADHELTGTIPVENGGTGASTLTGYVKGNGTSAMTAASTIPNTDITGLGTMSTQNANNVAITGGSISGATVSGYIPTSEKAQPLGVATLDAGGKVPTSQIPLQGDLNYQGTWNATTNTPTLTSSVGTQGYYYVVDVAGTTNLNGITDWQIGDWAIFNGSVWQKVDNTDAVTSVNGYVGTVVLTQPDIAGTVPTSRTISTGTGLTGGGDLSANRTISFSTAAVGTWAATPSSANLASAMTDETGSGSLVFGTSPTLSGPTIDGASPFINMTPTTAPTYAEGRVFYDSAAHTLNYYNDNNQMSVNIGQEQIIRVRNQTGSTIPDGSVVYVSGATGNTPTVALAIATAFNTSDIIGVTTTSIPNNDFGYATVNGLVNGLDTSAFSDGNPVFLSATTAGAFTATEPTAPNYSVQVGVIVRANPSVGTLLVATQQISTEVSHIIGTVAVSQGGTGQTSYTDGQLLIGNTTGNTLTKSTLTAGTAIGITNGAGSITVNNTGVTSAVAGTGISVSGATGAVTVTNTAPDQTVSITGGTGISATGTYPNFTVTNTAPDQTVVLSNGTGISVTGTYPNFTVTNTAPSSGGTVTSVTGTAPVSVATGTTTPVISMAAATGSVNGYLTSTDWTTFNSKAPAVTYTTNYVPFGQGTTTPNLSSSFTYVTGTGTLTAPAVSASNGLVINSNTVSASYSIPSGSSASSVGPMTVASGQTVTVPSGSRWVVL